MNKNIKYISFEYTSKDIDYIEELISNIECSIKEIINFFAIDNFGENVKVKLFEDLEEFRSKCSMQNRNIPLWLCGLSFYRDNCYNIYTLCLEEYKKTLGHNNCSLIDLKYLILHEFVHACCQKYHNNIDLYAWLSEGLATTISHQYDNKELSFDASLEQVIKGGLIIKIIILCLYMY